ncbi:hypothetical protein LINGRAHAP2_LOCUS19202, partial [Linum grandiflorum]
MGKQVSLNLATVFFFTVLVRSAMPSYGTKTNVVIPNDELEYCKFVVCKGLNCDDVYIDNGMCWCVHSGFQPQSVVPC